MKKLTIVALVLVLCLAAVGIGYAMWTDTIDISATVGTGDVDINAVDYSGTWVWKDASVQPCEMIVTGNDEQPTEGAILIARSWAQAGGEDSVVMTWENIFPDVCFMADVVFKYEGSIPAKVSVIDLVVDPEDSPLLQYVVVTAYRINEAGNLGEAVVEGTQLHDGDMVKLVVTLCIPEDNELMNLSLSASAKIVVAQWSEGPCEPETPTGA